MALEEKTLVRRAFEDLALEAFIQTPADELSEVLSEPIRAESM